MTRSSGNSSTQRLIVLVKGFMQFSMVDAVAYVVDVGLFNLLQHGPTDVLSGHPNSVQLMASSTATVLSWIANRYWTYRGRTQKSVAREATLFVLVNLGGIAITQFCLLFTHHVLELTPSLADNVAAYVVGFSLGTAFRFVFYHYIIFTEHKDRSPGDDDTNSTGPQGRPDSGIESSAVPISVRPRRPGRPTRLAVPFGVPDATAWRGSLSRHGRRGSAWPCMVTTLNAFAPTLNLPIALPSVRAPMLGPEWLDAASLITTIIKWFGSWAILGVMLVIFAEADLLIGFFLPGGSLLFTPGMFVGTGAVGAHIWVTAPLVQLAAVADNQTGYLIGRKAGPAIFNKPGSRLFKQEYVERTPKFFERHGGKAVTLTQFIPIVRTFTPVITGVGKMRHRHFIIFNVLSATFWAFSITWLGYFLGSFGWIREDTDTTILVIVFISVAPMLASAISRVIKSRRQKS